MERIGAYDVVGRLAEGRMGTVWLARSRGGRQLAVRVVRAELAADPAFRERFRAEAAALRTVGGLHTVPVVDADPDAAAPWMATAYVPGPTLARLLATEGPLAEERLRGLGTALAEALQEVHRCGLVHGDLKPGAVVMAADGPRVLDFSLARTLRDPRLPGGGPPFGTPGFLAPEQAAGLEPGPAADVFALGAVLVAAAGGGTLGSVQQGADLAAVPASLRPVVAACLDHDPARRLTTDQLLDRLSPFPAAPVPGPAPVPGYAHAVTIPPGPPVPVRAGRTPPAHGRGRRARVPRDGPQERRGPRRRGDVHRLRRRDRHLPLAGRRRRVVREGARPRQRPPRGTRAARRHRPLLRGDHP